MNRNNSFVSRALSQLYSRTSPRLPWFASVMVVLFMVAFAMRVLIAAVGPALELIRAELGISQVVAGLTSSLPLACFGLFAFLTPWVLRRLGIALTVGLVLLGLALGALVRVLPTPAGLLGGTVLIGIAAAIGNVCVPVAIRQYYPQRAGVLAAWYSVGLTVGAAAGAAATMPLIDTGLAWNYALNVWILFIALVFLWWVYVARRRETEPIVLTDGSDAKALAHTEAIPMRVLLTRGHVWAICLLIGIQGALFFSVLTWLPTWLTRAGFSASQAGFMTGIWSLVGLFGALIGPQILRLDSWLHLEIIYGLLYVVANVLLHYGGWGNPVLAWIGVLVSGACCGLILGQAYAFITGQADPACVPGISALGNGLGYIMAAASPALMGWFAALTDSWIVPIWVTALAPLPCVALAIPINRRIRAERTALRTARVQAVL